MIHPTAIVDAGAEVDPSARIGPYAVIDAGVKVGPECVVGPQVYLTGLTTIGARNQFFAGCVIGEAPQDLKYRGEPTMLRIGEGNCFREHVTVHRSNRPEEATVIGARNYFMQHSHVAHNSLIGDHVIVAGGALLAGHASVGDRAFISGNCLVHQFVRVGTLALMQGGTAVSQDLPPYTVVAQANGICGLNTVGLRRAGLTPAERLELKRLYHHLFRSGLGLRVAVQSARERFTGGPAKVMLDFIAASKRGVCADIRQVQRAAEADQAGAEEDGAL